MKSFRFWKRQEVQDAFGLKRVQTLPLLENWLQVDTTIITEKEKERIEEYRSFLAEKIWDWNEAELKFEFLGPFMRLVNFYTPDYRPFMERSLTAKLNGEKISGVLYFMVASGEQLPESPYFCIHEYKPEDGTSNDAAGQLLIVMVAAQQANAQVKKEIPVYGAYLLGRLFYFVVLHQQQYAISQPLLMTNQEVFKIFAMLRKVKGYINELIE